jgi:glycerophosphoryl diester phosphodiesterase
VTRRGIHAALAMGLVPLVYTVNDERRMRELSAAGVAGIFTDRPAAALRLFRAGSP